MSGLDKRTISLPEEQSSYIDALVGSGSYASASEVVRAGLRALQERDAAVKQWLKDSVAPVYDLMQKNPARGLSTDKVLSDLRNRHAKNVKQD
ncbi:MAG: type II toxin-antitoxin system ParD family antitoxin [Pseudomonadota bacterium]